ncbi:MAG: nucleotidyl transferase AbiEii/AbiGii toxin family protein, partial [Patescibacteria group bacterium]
ENLIQENYKTTNVFKRNLIKEYLQILVLSFIYSHPDYKNLIFYGGSCLKHCFGLDRLSEDLDFVDIKGDISLEKMSNDLIIFCKKEVGVEPTIKVQKFRIYLKLPILKKLKIADGSDSDLLFLKVEIFKQFDFCTKYKTEIIPIFKNNKTILIKSFDLETLMATKIRAIIHRIWEKTNKQGKTLIKAKGRDYYDLMWYLQKQIKPNLDCIPEVNNLEELKKKLLNNIIKLDKQSIKLDLEALVGDSELVSNLANNIKSILVNKINVL